MVAVSQDFLASNEICYGDVLVIPGMGAKIVSDVMHEKHNRRIDVWVSNHAEEKKFGIKRKTVSLIRSPDRECSRAKAQERWPS